MMVKIHDHIIPEDCVGDFPSITIHHKISQAKKVSDLRAAILRAQKPEQKKVTPLLRPVAYREIETKNINGQLYPHLIESGDGWFHQWVTEHESCDTGTDSWTFALIEKPDGSIIYCKPNEMQFLDVKAEGES